MRNIWIVIKHEIAVILHKPSFWLLTFIFPAFIALVYFGTEVLGMKALEEVTEEASSVEAQVQENASVGYVDEVGVIEEIPFWIPPDFFREYPTQGAAEAALDAGEIRQYYLIPEDFLETGEFLLVDRAYQTIRSTSNAEIFLDVLKTNLMADTDLGYLLANPIMGVQPHQLMPSTAGSFGLDRNSMLSFGVPFFTLFIFFVAVTGSSGFLLHSVTSEKENRTAEILLLSIKPLQLMAGKVIGLGLVALFQMVVWLGGMAFSVTQGSSVMTVVQAVSLPSSYLFWGALYFLLTYFMYASLLGALGALAPNSRESGSFVFVILFPLLIPLWFIMAFAENPDGGIATFLSMFPLTAVSMMTRLAVTDVPLWQILVSLSGLALTTYLAVLVAARFFRAEN
jgi:ABC-2 type transport system permease protein